MLHKELSLAETENYKAWAREHFDRATPVSETWHPVVREEWDRLLHPASHEQDTVESLQERLKALADYAEQVEYHRMEARASADEHGELADALMVTLGAAIDDRVRQALAEHDLTEQVQAALADTELSDRVRDVIGDMVDRGAITVEVDYSDVELDLSLRI